MIKSSYFGTRAGRMALLKKSLNVPFIKMFRKIINGAPREQ